MRPRLETQEAATPPPESDLTPTDLKDHAVIVGYGRVGSVIGEAIGREGWPILVIEDRRDLVEALRARDIEVIRGNAAAAPVLAAANVEAARCLFVAIPDAFEAGQIVQQARAGNAGLEIIARAHSDAEVEHLRQCGATSIVMGEREIARGMVARVRELKKPDH